MFDKNRLTTGLFSSSLLNIYGRANRKEFVLYQSLTSLVTVAVTAFIIFQGLASVFAAMGSDLSAVSGASLDRLMIVQVIVTLLMQLACIPVTLRRLNDLEVSGWWSSISLIPMLSFILVLYLSFAPGKPGPEIVKLLNSSRMEK